MIIRKYSPSNLHMLEVVYNDPTFNQLYYLNLKSSTTTSRHQLQRNNEIQ